MAQAQRDPTTGRFLTGNHGGPGTDKGSKRQRISNAFYAAVTESAMNKIVKALVAEAKGGDVAAARIILERFVAKMPQGIDLRSETLATLTGEVVLDFGEE